jgi:ribA/ribD-fused uncharacterized protein
VFFWGGIYSQWYKVPMIIDHMEYNCCEQYMMHQKALLFSDFGMAEKIMLEKDPKKQKALGRQVESFDRKIWDKVCQSVIYKGNLEKFTQNSAIKKELMGTGDRLMVEASPFDEIYGIKMAENDFGVEDQKNWKGTNFLGIAITKVKNKLQGIEHGKEDKL